MFNKIYIFLVIGMLLSGCSSLNHKIETCQGFECRNDDEPTWGGKTKTQVSPDTKRVTISGGW